MVGEKDDEKRKKLLESTHLGRQALKLAEEFVDISNKTLVAQTIYNTMTEPDPETSLTVRQVVTESYETSKAHGWHDDPNVTFGDRLMLMVSELAEALEEFRRGKGLTEVYLHHDGKDVPFREGDLGKPEGIPIELADVVIRIADLCGKEGIDLEQALRWKFAFNRTRPYRHGGKRL